MSNEEVKKREIESALRAIPAGGFLDAAKNLLGVLGYRSLLTESLPGTPDDFIQRFRVENEDAKTAQEFRKNVRSVELVSQVGGDEIIGSPPDRLRSRGFDAGLIKSFVFWAVELKEKNYSRDEYAQFTREINKRLVMPVVIFFRVRDRLTIGFVGRRQGKGDPKPDVLEPVILIKDIHLNKPHQAHIDLLFELSLGECAKWLTANKQPKNFDGLLAAWLARLDTEALNKKFYGKLFDWFEWAVTEGKFPRSEKRTLKAEEHVIRLITRMLFVWFLKEKGLVPDALFNEAQVRDLLKGYDLRTGDSYYRAVLQNLFFATLNTEIEQRGFSKRGNPDHRDFSRYRYKDQMRDSGKLLELFAQTPFINSGLFDCLDTAEGTRDGGYHIDCFSDEHYKKLSLPNCLFFDEERGLIPLLEQYKFTVEENTPIEQDVALDPELLGKVFENLLAAYNPETGETARKQTGSYYTPRPVVDYMVEETLVAILTGRVPPTDGDTKLWKERLHYLFDYAKGFDDASEWFDDDEIDGIVQAISELKILDPAVGSGAFPMGVLHKLTLVLRRLDANNSRWEQLQRKRVRQLAAEGVDTKDDQARSEELLEIDETFKEYRDSDFGRKLYLIQNSIFGIDIQPVACQIAKLRFFISLAIEQEPDRNTANFGIKPLPNLGTRFIAANTLIGLKGERIPTSAKAKDLERELSNNRERYFHATTRRRKLECKRRDEVLRGELEAELGYIGMPPDDAEKIAHWDPYDQNAATAFFDPERMFGVVDGFDVVIGNPPYGKGERLNTTLRGHLREQYGWSGDLYDYFIFAGFRLVAEKGIFSYIANDSYVGLPTKRRIRELFLQNQLLHLVKAPTQTFGASIYTAIFILLKGGVDRSHAYMSGEMHFPHFQYRSNGPVEYAMIHSMPDQKFLLDGANSWVLRLMTYDKVEKFCRVLDTGIHSGNVRSKVFFRENNAKRHRLLQGRQIQRFVLRWDSPTANYKFCDIDYEPLPIPGVGRGGKPSRLNEYWHFCGNIANHHQPERLLIRQTDDDLIVAYHSKEESGHFYTDNTLFTVLPNSEEINLKYLLALLNSRLLNFIYHSIAQEQGKNQAQVKISVVNKLPVVVPAAEQQRPVIALVDEILSAKSSNPAGDTVELEKGVNRRVYELYNLTSEEIGIVENWVSKSPESRLKRLK